MADPTVERRCNAKCPVCSRPTSDGALCVRCETKLTVALAQVPALVEELDLTITRQTAMGRQQGSRSAEKPLPANLDASEVADNLKATLVGWVRDIQPDINQHPKDNLTSISRWLLSHVPTIRTHPDAEALHDEVTYAIRETWRAIDRPANRSRVLVADCLDVGCDGQLWAYIPVADYVSTDPSTHAKITCNECEVTYPAEQWMHVGRRVLAARRAA